MYRSRLHRFNERHQQLRIFYAVTGSIALLIFLGLFGIRILIAFSVFVDKLRGTAPKQQEQTILLPPEFDPLPEATNSAQTWVTGRAQPKITVLLYVNDDEPRKVTVQDDGTFKMEKIMLHEGINTISGKTSDEKDTTSSLSEILRIIYKRQKPVLEITTPTDGQTISGDKKMVTVTGKTDEGNMVTINDRFAVVSANGLFSYDLPLQDGEQTIKVIAKDIAGNETSQERKVTYRK